MYRLKEKHKLSAITIRCFDLLKYGYTACLGTSLCNDEGFVAGCEADLEALLTMMIVSYLTGEPCWMANPSRIEKNKLVLAHCTIATKMISKATLLPHMESGKCVAVRGPLKKGKATLVRFGSGRMQIAVGEIVRSDMQEPDLCRTQVELRIDDPEKWIENALGNHQVLVYGDIKQMLLDFCRFKGIKAI